MFFFQSRSVFSIFYFILQYNFFNRIFSPLGLHKQRCPFLHRPNHAQDQVLRKRDLSPITLRPTKRRPFTKDCQIGRRYWQQGETSRRHGRSLVGARLGRHNGCERRARESTLEATVRESEQRRIPETHRDQPGYDVGYPILKVGNAVHP